MHGPINVKSPINTNKWQMGFNSAFKRLMQKDNIEMCVDELRVRTRVRLIWFKTGNIDFGNEFSGSEKRWAFYNNSGIFRCL
jgi:hypothetical protein